jgi:ABC-type glycerol-3-phosphate transport system substrate-binding protein
MDTKRTRVSRRTFLQVAGATGLAVACGPAAPPTAASPAAPTAAPATPKGLTGTVTISYPDELGKKPPYVQKAADALKAAHAALDVKIDHQKISSGDYYTKTLLALTGGDAPDVIHVGGDRIGELADAGHIAPLDEYLAKWEDWKSYPEAIK